MCEAWMKIVENYSGRKASVESDKLVACAGIAEQFHRVLRSDYLAGLWRSDTLSIDLLWKPDHYEACTRPTVYRAPSWSWAAVEGSIHRHSLRTLGLEDPPTGVLVEIIDCQVTLEDDELPFGRVTGGILVLHGALIPCRGGLAKRSNCSAQWYVPLPSLEQARREQWGLRDLNLDEEDKVYSTEPGDLAAVTMDCNADELPGRMWVVPFVRARRRNYDDLYGIALALAPLSNNSGSKQISFRRIGHYHQLVAMGTDIEWPLMDITIV